VAIATVTPLAMAAVRAIPRAIYTNSVLIAVR